MTAVVAAPATVLRVALIGGGPKALHALERLFAYLPTGAPVHVTIFEPTLPGAGPAYDPQLDPALLMNLRADAIDAWPRHGPLPVRESAAHPSFARWNRAQGAPAPPYPPRREVGRYLAWAFDQVLSGADGRAVVVAEPVAALRQTPAGQREATGQAGQDLGVFDEVLLATGHGLLDPGFDGRRLDALGCTRGRRILARGFGLTTVDLIRLVEARGDWQRGTRMDAVSRSGRPPLAKPEPAIDAALRAACGDPAQLPWPDHGALAVAWLRAATAELAMGVLEAARGRPCGQAEVEDALAELERRTPVSQAAAVDRLGRSIRIAVGREQPDATAAIGVAWRVLQDGLAAHGSFGGVPASELPALRAYAAALELVAFGPPVAAARSVLHALQTGAVTVHHAPAGPLPLALRASADLTVDAVLPAPGVIRGSLIADLVASGDLTIVTGARGILVAPDGSALDAEGDPVPGLAAIGRPTEDSVLANDTLSRTMHAVAEGWGRRVAALAATTTARAA